ncbi:MAG: methionine sulfoxide reductase, partial [Sulfurovum sp.]
MIRILVLALLLFVSAYGTDFTPWKTRIEKLSDAEKHVIIDKGTERPWSGKYVNKTDKGVYRCKVCGAALYRSDDKFNSH